MKKKGKDWVEWVACAFIFIAGLCLGRTTMKKPEIIRPGSNGWWEQVCATENCYQWHSYRDIVIKPSEATFIYSTFDGWHASIDDNTSVRGDTMYEALDKARSIADKQNEIDAIRNK